MTSLVHRGQCFRLEKHLNDHIDSGNFLSNILNEPKLQSTPLVSRIPKSSEPLLSHLKPKKTITKPTKSLPSSSKVIRKSASVKSTHFIKPVTKTVNYSKDKKQIKSLDNYDKKQFQTNLSNLKSKSVQNLTDTKKSSHIIRKNSYPDLQQLKREQTTKASSSNFDAIKLLEFLIQKAKQSNDSKNVTFDSLFNELNQMNKKLCKSKPTTANLDSSLDIKLDQMENEIEILRTQLNQNCNKLFSSPKRAPIKINNNSNDNERVIRLQNELKESNKKCQVLEYLLEQKNKQTEKYNFLFKEINDNLNMLLDEISDKEVNFNQNRFFNTNDTHSLKENLVKFQSKLRHHFRNDAYFYTNDKYMLNTHEKDTLNTTSSNTLIDADSSFESANFNALVSQKKFYINDDTKDTSSNYIFKKNTKYYQMKPNDLDDEYEDDDDDDRILTLDDLSITTIQTSAVDETETENVNNYEDEFSSDLQKLDQKIFQVKKLLQSMKTS